MNDTPDKSTWPEFAIVIFDLLTGRKAELTWEFDDLPSTFPSRPETIQSTRSGR